MSSGTSNKTFYTNSMVWGNKILYRGVRNGKRVLEKADYQPSLFVPTPSQSQYTTLKGKFLEKMDFASISEAREFVKMYKDVENFQIFGNTKYEYTYIYDNFPKTVDWFMYDILVGDVDIECKSDDGFPTPELSNQEITAITYATTYHGKRVYHVFGCKEYKNSRSDVIYYRCKDEIELLKKFLLVWTHAYPDVLTGWNIVGFDIPYLYNRMTKLLGEKEAKKISPWSIVFDKEVEIKGMNMKIKTYSIKGISILDYQDLYKWFAPDGKSQENYKLDTIGFVELGEKKLDYSSYGNLTRLYEEDYQLFIDYNIKDVALVDRLNDKLRLIELALTLAYDNKCNFEDVFAQVRMWTVIVANILKERNILLDHNTHHTKDDKYIGAYVKPVMVGRHKNIASFDFSGLYPATIMCLNLSPETILDPDEYPEEVAKFLSQNVINVDTLLNRKVDTSILKKYNLCLSPNGQVFTRDKLGFIPEILQTMATDRKTYKKLMLSKESELEKLKESGTVVEFIERELEYEISKNNNLQLAKKVGSNSSYGAMGNEFFLLFDLRIAIATTLGGQLATKNVIMRVNRLLAEYLGEAEDSDYIIAADTDSAYITLEKVLIKNGKDKLPEREQIEYMDQFCKEFIQPKIIEFCADLMDYVNAYTNKLDMKREKLSSVGIWTAKKHYILNVFDDEGVRLTIPKIEILGMEAIKAAFTPKLVRDKLKEAYEIILNHEEVDLIKFVDKFRNEFNNLPVEDIAFPRGVNGVAEHADEDTVYTKGSGAHLRGSLIYNKLLKDLKLDKKYEVIKGGNKIRFLWLKEPNPSGDNIISFPETLPKEFELHDYIDKKMQFEKSFEKPIRQIVELFGWSTQKKAKLPF